MKKIIKFVFTSLIISVIISMLCLVTYADSTNVLTDVNDDYWANNEIFFVYFKGALFREYGRFYPTDGLTRGEAIKGITDILDLNIPKHANTDFTDVPYSSEYSGAVKWASDNNIAQGTGDDMFSPNTVISRQAFCVFIYKTCLVQNITLPVITQNVNFNDQSSIASWALPSVTVLAKANILQGYSNGNFGPTDTITRAAGATILSRLYAISESSNRKILLYVRASNGTSLSNAAVYIYYRNNNPGPNNHKYPEEVVYTDAAGIAHITPPNNDPYAVNVFAFNYRQGLCNDYLSPDYFMKTIIMNRDTGMGYSLPLAGFNNLNEWATTRTYLDSCQNFGWRYNSNSQYEYHQGIDIGRPTGTPVYSSSTGKVVQADWFAGCGYLVQIDACYYEDEENEENNKYYYFIYQHLNSYSVSVGDDVIQNQQIGTVGATGGNYSPHLHFSISNKTAYGVTSRDYMDPLAFIRNQTPYNN